MSPENHVSSSLKKAQIPPIEIPDFPYAMATDPCALEKDDLIHVDQDDRRFGCAMSVRVKTEDSMLHRKDDARELLKNGDVVFLYVELF